VALVAVLDTCVLYPVWVRDVLLSLAEAELYQPLWSPQILQELVENLAQLRPPPDARRLVEQMSLAFPEALVTDFESLVAEMGCHPKDAHVLAAAVCGEAQFVVTANLKDFPATATDPHAIVAVHPDQFCMVLFEQGPERVISTLRARAAQSDVHLGRWASSWNMSAAPTASPS
jgi:predicted nucleic acid-binding protein